MKEKKELVPREERARLTINLSFEKRKHLKAQSALMGKSMRDLVVEAIDRHLAFLGLSQDGDHGK